LVLRKMRLGLGELENSFQACTTRFTPTKLVEGPLYSLESSLSNEMCYHPKQTWHDKDFRLSKATKRVWCAFLERNRRSKPFCVGVLARDVESHKPLQESIQSCKPYFSLLFDLHSRRSEFIEQVIAIVGCESQSH